MSARGHGVVVTGGGTAGHVLPALAVCRALVEGGREPGEVRYVGSSRGMEVRLVPEAGFPLLLLPGRGIERRLSRAAVGAALGLVGAGFEALVLLARDRPEAVATVGGYAGVPCSLAAFLLRIPVVVVNVDAVPGAANRLAGRFAKASAIALPGTPLPRAVLTGAPVRPEVLAVDRTPEGRAAARAVLGFREDQLVVAVAGGSLGARRLNEAALGLARRWAGRRDLVLYHVAGERDHERVLAGRPAPEPDGLDYRVVAYESRLPELLAAADLFVGRAGASTVAELSVVGTPSVLVPLPGAPGDHQTKNAARLAETGAAVVLADADATAERLGEVAESLLASPQRREEMAEAARRLGRPDAASRVAALVEEAARTPSARPRWRERAGRAR